MLGSSLKIPVETQIRLNKFKPRAYQLPILDAIENKGYKRVLAILPRRAGKDITAFNLCIRACLKKICVIYYVFPTYSQAKKVIWDSITNTGERILDFIPSEVIESKNSQEMKIRFRNGSLLQLVGSDNYDTLMGTNPQGVVFSEYALQDPRAYQYIRPILVANDGWALFISTPRGKNHLWELYNIASRSSDWFAYKLSVLDTGHISLQEIEKERQEGLISEDLIMQEYYCSFDMGVEGSYYGKYIDRMRMKGQIGQVPWEAGFKVHTAWDLGVRDSTTIIFFQVIGQTIRLIDSYENNKEGLEHYVKVLESKPYSYGKHIAPHDIKVKEWGTGITRLEKARQLGINFTVAPDVSIIDGIEAVRTALGKCWIDEVECKDLVKAIENYRQEFDPKKKVYKSHPLHDWSSHACFTADIKVLTRSGMRPIIELTNSDEILTHKGWMSCSNVQMTQKNAKLVEVLFQDGMKVRCTPDHLFKTVEGWRSAKDLVKDTKIQSSLMSLLNTLMDLYTEYMHEKSIFLREDPDYTEMSGSKLLERYQHIVTYIIETIIPLITVYQTLNVSQVKTILSFQDQITKDLHRKLVMLQLRGIDLLQEFCGISDMLKDALHGLSGEESLENVCTVEKNIMHLSENKEHNRNIVIQIVRPLLIESVTYLAKQEDVYDIYVPEMHEFSLSNHALVHNCDAMRYLCISLPKTRDSLSPEELDQRYNEARYGHHSNVPSFFRDEHGRY